MQSTDNREACQKEIVVSTKPKQYFLLDKYQQNSTSLYFFTYDNN